MFDRTRTDNSPADQTTLTAEITLGDGSVMSGKFVIAASRSLFEVLNGSGGFIDFEPFGGERQFIAKSALRSVKLVPVPRAADLAGRLRALDGFDPHSTLGVGRDAAWDEVRHAYLQLSKRYHPDRYASAELPAEVADYLAAMARRINAAFAMLDANRQSSQAPARKRVEPIYETRARN